MRDWIPFLELQAHVTQVLDGYTCDQTPPSPDKIFDRMFAICSVAEPEERLNFKGDHASVGHAVIYEKWGPDGCECDGWLVTCFQNDGGYEVSKIGDRDARFVFSHEDEQWPDELHDLLVTTLWKPLRADLLLRG